MGKRSVRRALPGAITAAVALMAGSTSYAVDFLWTNAGGDNNYLNTNNWKYADDTVATNLPSVSGDVSIIDLSGADRLILTSDIPGNINSIHVGFNAATAGEIEQNGGTVKATANASRYSRIGVGSGATGLWTLNDGAAELNRCDIGGGGGVGTVVVNDGTFKVARGNGGYSLRLDIGNDAGVSQGYFEISGGLLSTRVGVLINDYGTFTVKGGESFIQIGGAGTGDAIWTQAAGGTLAVQVADTGLSPIEIDNDTGASDANFKSGALLNPSFLDGFVETNAWVVMTCEGTMTDEGLALAPGVDSNWSFGMTRNPVDEVEVLWIGYGGAEYVPPELPDSSTNRYVNAAIPMPDSWHLYAPLPGNSLSDQSSSGFTATIAANTYTNDRSGFIPVVAQEFAYAQALSSVGQSVTVNFDIVMLDAPNTHDKDFHYGFYDTNLNVQIWSGFDLGAASGSQQVMRYNDQISALSTNEFLPGDYGWFGTASSSFGAGANYSGAGLVKDNVMHFQTTFARTDTNEVTFSTYMWDYTGSGSTGNYSQVINELAPPNSELPTGFKWESLNGFAFNLFENEPFAAGVGSYVVSNFTVSAVNPLPDGWGYSVTEIVVESTGDITLTLSDPIAGAVYEVMGTTDLQHVAPTLVGTYAVDASGTIVVPAADAGLNRFFDVELPVYEVIE